jgi:hypothetical protein
MAASCVSTMARGDNDGPRLSSVTITCSDSTGFRWLLITYRKLS